MAETASLKVSVDSKDAEQGAKRVADALKRLGADSDKAEAALKKLGVSSEKSASGTRKAGDAARKAGADIKKMGMDAQMTSAQMTKLNASAERAGRVIGTAFRSIAAAFSVNFAVNALSQVQSIENQFKLLSDSQEEVSAGFNKVANIAKKVGAPLAETASLYSRLVRQADALKLSQEGVDQVMTAVAAGIKVSGQAASQLQGPLLQLQQGLAAGTFRAEEFNSVNEGMPDLMRAVEKAMFGAGAATGTLRKELLAGNVSSQQFAAALAKAAPEIQALADKMSLTIPQAMENVRTSFLQWIQGSNEAQIVAAALANAIQWVADNMNIIAPIVAALAATWITTFTFATFVMPFVQLGAQIVTTAGAFTKLFALLAANPFVALAAVIATVVAATILWLTTTEDGQKLVTDAINLIKDSWETLKSQVQSVADAVASAWNSMVSAISSAIQRIKSFIDGLIAKFKELIAIAKKALGMSGGGSVAAESGGGGGSTKMAGGGSITYLGKAAGGMGFTVPGNGNSDTFRAMVDLMPGEQLNVTPKKYAGPRDGGLTVRDIAEGVARGSYNIVASVQSVDNSIARTGNTQRKIEYSTSQTYDAVQMTNKAAYEQVYAIKEAGKVKLEGGAGSLTAARWGFRPIMKSNQSRSADSTRPSLTGGTQSFGENLFSTGDPNNPNLMGDFQSTRTNVTKVGDNKYQFGPPQSALDMWDQAQGLAEQLFGEEGKQYVKGIKPFSFNINADGYINSSVTNYQPLIQQMKNYETRVKKDQFLTDYKAAFLEARGSMDTFEYGSHEYGQKSNERGETVMQSTNARVTTRDQQAMAAARSDMYAAVASNNYNIGVDINVNGVQDADSFRPATSQIEMELANAVRNATARR